MAQSQESVQCYGCGASFSRLADMKIIPGADGRDGRHHCNQCYAEWLAEVMEA